MTDASHRLLRLLELLSRQPRCTARALATTLEVTPRTVRRDIDRLRQIGYPIDTGLGPGGGYGLPPGTALPPLPFDAAEAATVLLALREAELNPQAAALASSAATKLRRAVPAPLRMSAAALDTHLSQVHVGRMIGAPARYADLEHVALLARACRERRRVACSCQEHDDATLHLEPHHLVRALGRWWVLALDVSTTEWITLAVDDITSLALTTAPATHARFSGDPQRHVVDHVRGTVQRVQATVRVHAPAAAVGLWVEAAWCELDAESDTTTIVRCGADSYDAMARWLLLLRAEITVIAPADLRDAFADVAAAAARAAHSPA